MEAEYGDSADEIKKLQHRSMTSGSGDMKAPNMVAVEGNQVVREGLRTDAQDSEDEEDYNGEFEEDEIA